MNEILHANVFFVIASLATVAFCIIICLILFHILKIVKSIRAIIERIEAGSEVIANDVAQVRTLIANGGMVSRFFQFIMGATRESKKTKKRARSEN
ncbi:hypothetical protein H6785_01670 [Candidatus Nomurabacteria bacterium]|nr:hypothetical protein [Candidatus Kaiserbacteria bacterium]MCB9815271.1 hypothetical protein [Candidatus Nomurabacteria bacterium]